MASIRKTPVVRKRQGSGWIQARFEKLYRGRHIQKLRDFRGFVNAQIISPVVGEITEAIIQFWKALVSSSTWFHLGFGPTCLSSVNIRHLFIQLFMAAKSSTRNRSRNVRLRGNTNANTFRSIFRLFRNAFVKFFTFLHSHPNNHSRPSSQIFRNVFGTQIFLLAQFLVRIEW